LRDNEFGTHEEDAARRDFTLNALYYDPLTEEVRQFHRGVSDLQKGVVRMIGDPVQRYREDPVRMLRAVRFASKLSGTIEPGTLEPIQRLAPLIENVPASRLFDETLKLLTCGHAMDCLRMLREVGLHHDLMPLLDVVFNVPDGEAFVDLGLARTDLRVRSGKPGSSCISAGRRWRQKAAIPPRPCSRPPTRCSTNNPARSPSSAALSPTFARSGSCRRASSASTRRPSGA